MTKEKIKGGSPLGSTHYILLESYGLSEVVYFKKTKKGFLVYNVIMKGWQRSTYDEQYLEAI